jgi:hypothetical protein
MAVSAAEVRQRLEDEIAALIEKPPDPVAAIKAQAEDLFGIPVEAKAAGDHVVLTWEEEVIEVDVRVA